MPAGRFFAFAERLVAYSGAVRMRRQIELTQASDNVTPIEQVRSPTMLANGRPEWAEKARSVGRTDEGYWLVDGCAYDDEGVPIWARRNLRMSSDVSVIPAIPAAMNFSPSFQGQFSYAQVKAESADEQPAG